MADPVRKRATYEDLCAVPEEMIAEIIDGELVTQRRLAPRYAYAASSLLFEVGAPFDRGRGGPGGWRMLFLPELHLVGDVIVPDLAAWRRSRMPEMPDVQGFELPPDWACEVLSPPTAARDRADKVPIYERERVGHVWLVDPAVRTLEVLALDGPGYRLVGTWHGDVKVRAVPFDAVELELGGLWGW